MQGQKSSSTRMELAAWISALTNNTPIHMGTDSKSMMDKAVIMMKSAAKWNQDQSATWWIKRNPFKKPWGLQPDGDLWESVWEAYLARGTDAQELTKVKGHATDRQVELGEVKDRDKKGNDKSDQFADYGVEEHGSAVVQLTMWLYKRQKQYAEFMQHVQAVIISVLGKEREEREKRVKTQSYVLGYDTSKEAKVSCSLPNAKTAAQDTTKLGLAPPISGLHKHQHHQKRYENIHYFLTQREWISRAEEKKEGGMTWLELMVTI